MWHLHAAAESKRDLAFDARKISFSLHTRLMKSSNGGTRSSVVTCCTSRSLSDATD